MESKEVETRNYFYEVNKEFGIPISKQVNNKASYKANEVLLRQELTTNGFDTRRIRNLEQEGIIKGINQKQYEDKKAIRGVFEVAEKKIWKQITEEEPIALKARTLQEMFDEGIPEIQWRTDKIVPKRGITFLGGTSGSYKTWAGMQLALSIGNGKSFLQTYNCEQCNVLYIDEENGSISLFARFQKLIKGHNYKEPFDKLHVANFANIKLDTPMSREVLDQYLIRYDIKVIVIDSMVRCMEGQEDKATDVRKVFDNLKLLMESREELSIIILHHTTKAGKGLNGLRGSGDFAAFADVVLMFNPIHSRRLVEVEVAKHRHLDLSQFNQFYFEIIPGEDESITLQVSSNTGAKVDIIEEGIEVITCYIQDNSLTELKTGIKSEIFKLLFERNYTKHNCYEIIKVMVERGHLLTTGKGKHRIGFLPVQEEQV